MELWDILDKNRNKTGRLAQRGLPLEPGEYHLVVHIWVKNRNGEWLISKRTPNKTFPGMWEATGGSAITGEDSKTAAMREVKEELGISLDPSAGLLYKSYLQNRENASGFIDVWIFPHDCHIDRVVLQEGETCDAAWVSLKQILSMIDDGRFMDREIYPYIDELYDSDPAQM